MPLTSAETWLIQDLPATEGCWKDLGLTLLFSKQIKGVTLGPSTSRLSPGHAAVTFHLKLLLLPALIVTEPLKTLALIVT